tara:strand:+ start:5051 stop:5254 length:204 start_codon:yes stop_codon:yes gene_type:complete
MKKIKIKIKGDFDQDANPMKELGYGLSKINENGLSKINENGLNKINFEEKEQKKMNAGKYKMKLKIK